MPSRRTSLPVAGAIIAAGSEPVEAAFAEVGGFIEQARQRAYQAVNTQLVGLYWDFGRYVSAKLRSTTRQTKSSSAMKAVRGEAA